MAIIPHGTTPNKYTLSTWISKDRKFLFIYQPGYQRVRVIYFQSETHPWPHLSPMHHSNSKELFLSNYTIL